MLESTESLEKQMFRAFWDDGLLDVFASSGVLSMGLFWVFDVPVGAAIAPAMLFPLWAPVRQKLIEPRLGLVEFTDERESRSRRSLRSILYAGIATCLGGIAIYALRTELGIDGRITFIAGLPAVLLALLAIFATIIIGSARFAVYACILAMSGVIGATLGWEPGIILTVAGFPMFLIAAGVLGRFLKKYPIDSGPPE